MVDASYMDAKFRKYLKALADGKDASQILDDLHRAFSMLSQEEQRFAQQILDDVLNGRLAPAQDKTLTDYVTAYEKRAKDDRIHRFAEAFGADEEALRSLVDAQPQAGEINAYGRFDTLLATVDLAKAATFFSALEGHPVSQFQANLRTDEYFRKFISTGGFPIPGGSLSITIGDADAYDYAEAAEKEDSREKNGDGYRTV